MSAGEYQAQTNAIIESNAVQFSAQIKTNISPEKPLVTDGTLLVNLSVHNIGSHDDQEIPPSKEISKYSWYQEYSSEILIKFFGENGVEPQRIAKYPVSEYPIFWWNKSPEINVKEKIPDKTSKIEVTLACNYDNPSKPCKEPKAEKINYIPSKYLKVLIIDASRLDDNIKVPNFRSEIESIYGNSNFLKSAWSSIFVGPKYAKQALLLYNKDKGIKPDSDDTITLLNALNKTYGKFYTTKILELNWGNFDQFAYRLSNCGLDDSCETNLYWNNLAIGSNRFSPDVLVRNKDVDYIIFLPSNY